MNKHTIPILAFTILSIFLASAIASPSKEISLPGNAKEISPGIYDLGSKYHNGELVQGLAFIHYKDEKIKNQEKAARPPKPSNCYTFLASGAKWKFIEPWIMNPSNTRNLNESNLFSITQASISKWETAALKDILGYGSATSSQLIADTDSPDNLNEVYFAPVSYPGAIAVTIVWGIFSGPPMNRKLVEWDQVYDDSDFDWSLSGDPLKMDYESIATHELGHSVGLGDLYNTDCSLQTMYGYATEGETIKRTLESGDITGIRKLYA